MCRNMLIYLHYLTLVIIFISQEAEGQSPLYPDLTCHEAYLRPDDEATEGEAWIIHVMDICNSTELLEMHGCYKKCVFNYHRILSSFDLAFKLTRMGSDGNMFTDSARMFTNENARSKVAERIFTCEPALKAVLDGGLPCEEWQEFYNCVETAWGCQWPEPEFEKE